MYTKPRWMLVFGLLFLFIFSTMSSAEIVISLYNANPAGSALTNMQQLLIDEFQAANPGIVVEHVYNPGYVQAMEKAMVAWAAGMAPNLIILEQSRWFTWAVEDYILPIDEFMATDDSVSVDDLYPGIAEALTWDGKLWGLPHQMSTPVMYQNKNLFRESGLEDAAPRTWDELRHVSRRITRGTDTETAIWGFAYRSWGWLFEAWLGQNGARVSDAEGRRFTFASDEAIQAMEWVQSFVLEDEAAYPGNPGSFYNGILGMYYETTGGVVGAVRNAANAGIDLGIAPLACNTECYAPIGGGNLYMLNTGTAEEREAAWKLMSYMSSADNLARLSAETGFMAGRRSSVQSQFLQDHFYDNPHAIVTYEQLEVAMPRFRVPGVSGPPTTAFGNEMWQGISVRTRLTELERQRNQQLDEWWAEFDARTDGKQATEGAEPLAATDGFAEGQRIRSLQPEYAPEEAIRIAFRGGSGHSESWIGVYRVDQRPGSPSQGFDQSLLWSYVDGMKAGEITFAGAARGADTWPLIPGDYVAHLFMDGGYSIMASTEFQIQ